MKTVDDHNSYHDGDKWFIQNGEKLDGGDDNDGDDDKFYRNRGMQPWPEWLSATHSGPCSQYTLYVIQARGYPITKFSIAILVLLVFYTVKIKMKELVKMIKGRKESQVSWYYQEFPILIICALMIAKETDVFHYCPILVANWPVCASEWIVAGI